MKREKTIGYIVFTIFKVIGICVFKYFKGLFIDIFNIFKDVFYNISPIFITFKNRLIYYFKYHWRKIIKILCVLIFIVCCFIYEFLFFTLLGITVGILFDMLFFLPILDIDKKIKDWKYPYISVTLLVIASLILPICGGIVGYKSFCEI